jgi:hypothetical protein
MRASLRLLVLAAVLPALPALPCSLSGDVSDERVLAVSPRSGARGVPINAEVKVLLNTMRKTTDFELRHANGGDLVPSDVSVVGDRVTERVQVGFGDEREERTFSAWTRLVRLRPKQRLPPNTVLEVRWLQENRPPERVTMFSTGLGLDIEPPAEPEYSASYVETLLDKPCSGTSLHGAWNLKTSGARDDQTPEDGLVFVARFSTAGPDGGVEAREVAWAPDFAVVGDTGKVKTLASSEPRALDLSVRALDWAGNESPASTVALSPGLVALPPLRAVRKTCGCTSWPSGVPALALLLLALRKRNPTPGHRGTG